MTIKEYAANKKVSPQAVYQRLKKNKIKVESLTEKGSGEISGEGMAILDKLFSSENRQIKPAKDDLIEELNKQLSTLRQENAALIEKAKAAEERADFFKAQQVETNEALQKALDIQQQTLNKFLPAAGQTTAGDQRKLTWRERFTGRIK